MMIHLVDGQRLLNVGGEITGGTLESASTTMILHMPVEIPFVGCTKIASDALDHGH